MERTPSWNEIPDDLEGAARANALNRREFLRRSAATAGIAMSTAALLSPEKLMAAAIRAQRTPVPLGNAMPIDHFVILMMENRSFDHYFGWLSQKYDPDKVRASQHETYVDPTGREWKTRHHTDVLGENGQWQGCGFGDPGHGWSNGRAQVAGGFMAAGAGNDEFALTYFDEGELAFIHPAAAAFTLYENYFCSLLASTWPNRYYKWSAQSGGIKDNTPPVGTAGNQWDTIFDRAMSANPAQVPDLGPTARYYNSDLPFSAVWGARAVPWTRPAAEFYADCAAGTLPSIAIIDPPFRDGGGFDGESADEHPLGDVRLGQAFMSDVAQAVMSSPLWPRTAMFVIYDEWGGFFDHVKPPRAADDDRKDADINKDFSQMGFRTPTVVLSPYTLGGGISTLGPFGHESILKLIEQRFAFAPLCRRDAAAMSIGESFNWKANPNADPPTLPDPSEIVTTACTVQQVQDQDGTHVSDMDALEELAHRVGVPVGEGKPHQIFREPSKVTSAYVPRTRV